MLTRRAAISDKDYQPTKSQSTKQNEWLDATHVLSSPITKLYLDPKNDAMLPTMQYSYCKTCAEYDTFSCIVPFLVPVLYCTSQVS